MTSWAVLALMDLTGANSGAVQRGIEWLRSMQRDDGSWPSQSVNGVFFGSAMLDYRLYKTYFPVWALARYATQTRQ
jgi:lanosterol synthase